MTSDADSDDAKVFAETYPLEGLEEHVVVEQFIEPHLKGLPENIIGILYYGCTEMLNNAIDHSEGTTVAVMLTVNRDEVGITIADDGVGIFSKIQRELNLETPHDAIIELCKGKLTTDPKHHTGEGIFFTARACDVFAISSGGLLFGHRGQKDWLVEFEKLPEQGTMIVMEVKKNTARTIEEVFNKYTSKEDDDTFGFSKTHFPVALAQYGPDKLISRSIAKRVVNGFYKFKEVVLDFKDVDNIGPAFADEIFRVFATSHPEVHLTVINAKENVARMIRRAQNASTSSEE